MNSKHFFGRIRTAASQKAHEEYRVEAYKSSLKDEVVGIIGHLVYGLLSNAMKNT